MGGEGTRGPRDASTHWSRLKCWRAERRTCGKRRRGAADASRGEPVPRLLLTRQRAGRRKNSGIRNSWRLAPPPHSTRGRPPHRPPCLPTSGELMNAGRPALLANGEARQWLAGPRAVLEFLPAGIGRSPKLSWKGEWDSLTHGKERPQKLRVSYRGPSLASLWAPTLPPPQLTAYYLFMESNDALKLYVVRYQTITSGCERTWMYVVLA